MNRTKVESKLPRAAVQDMLRYLRGLEHLNLWGSEQPNDHLEATLYHEVFNVGYQRLCRSVGLDFSANDSSLRYNAVRIRHNLKEWAKTHIHLGDVNEYKGAARHVKRPNPLEDVCLWADSTDLPLMRHKGWEESRTIGATN